MELDRFIDELCALEVDPREIEADPSGDTWLPASLRRAAAANPECARELADFIDMERALVDVHEPCDAFFTRRVMDQLPQLSDAALQPIDDQRRTWILASAYALAIGLGYVLLAPLASSGDVSSWFEPVHSWYHDHAIEAGGAWMALALLCTAGALVVLPTGRRRSAA